MTEFALWRDIETTLGRSVQPRVRKSLLNEFGMECMERVLEALPGEMGGQARGSANMLYVIAQKLLGDDPQIGEKDAASIRASVPGAWLVAADDAAGDVGDGNDVSGNDRADGAAGFGGGSGAGVVGAGDFPPLTADREGLSSDVEGLVSKGYGNESASTLAISRPLTSGCQPAGFVDDEVLSRLPTTLQLLVEHRLQGTEICPDFAISGAIATFAAIVGNKVRIRAWGDQKMLNEYFLLVGESGTSFKSAMPRRANEILGQVAPELLAPNEGSGQGLITELQDNPSLLWVKDEFAGLLVSIDKNDYMRTVREMLLELFDRGPGPYKRKLSQRLYTAQDVALSILGTIQPRVLGEELITGRNIGSGLVNRLLLVVGEGMAETWPMIEDSYRVDAFIRERLSYYLTMTGGTVIDGEHLRNPANLWKGQEREIFGEYGPAVATRASTHALKLAAIFECTDHWPITGTVVQEKWLDVALKWLERLFTKSSALIESVHLKTPGEQQRRDILTYLQGRKSATEGEISKALHLSAKATADHIGTLKARGSVWEKFDKDDDGADKPSYMREWIAQ